FFSVGGHSLLFIQLYHHYQSVFNFDAHTLSIAPFLQQPTIFQHSQLLQTVILNNIKPTQWYTLHINEGVASFAQERIFLDEQVRFSSDIAVYNELFTLQIVQGSLSFSRLLQAFRYVLNKHKILRTSLILNNDNSSLKQCITDIHKTFTITMNQTFENDTDLRDIIHRITINPTFFDFSIGCVFHAEILRHQISSDENENNSNEFIMNSDVLLIAFHHAAFDRSSRSIFFSDLYLAYNTNTISIEDDDESLQYIDYSVHERLIDMTISREFWYSQLEEYNFEYRLLLPVDRHRLFNDQRSSCASITQISFDNEISQSFLDYASLHHVTPFQLGLSILYAFLFKLTHGENDLCISCLNANRHKTELQSIMGMFVSILPYRIQLDPHRSFDDLVEYVRKKCLSILEHSHYPLQHILANLHINQSNSSFLETMFDFITISSHSEELSLDGTSFKQVSFKQSFEVAKFDFMVTFTYNPMLENNRLSFRLTCSHDLFDEITVTNIGRRLEYCFQQVFSSNEIINRIDTCYISISKVDLIVPEETQEMENAIFCRQSDIMNEAPASFAQARIWLDERIRFDPDKPQIAIYNMPFVYRLQPDHTLSIKQLRHALHLTINKHPSLHTSLLFDTGKHLIMQRIIDMNDNSTQLFTSIESTYETDEQLNQILHDERRNPQLFDLAQGLVFRCHIIYYKQISSNHLLSHKDVLIFNFHHALFDFPSMNIFLHDLNQAYTTGQLLYDDNTTLRYLDYAVIEQQMSMTGASMFWLDALHNCTLDQLLSLPFDRYRLSNEHRTGRGTSVSFDFGQDLSHDFLIYASSSNISLEQLALATYYVFLFKLTNGEKDLCIGINTHGRYRDELRSIIGMFVNAIPLRCLLDPHLSFHKLMEHVQDIMINCNKYSYFPLQRILNQHPNISNPVFLDTSFDFVSSMRRDEENEIMIGDNRFSLLPFSVKISEDEIMSKFDFILSFEHDLNLNEFSCTINASVDLFNAETVCIIARRLQTMLHQQFIPFDSKTNKPIHELSIILSNERLLIQSMNNTQISFPSVSCIHLEFVYQVLKHPQKLAVELDEQSLTYCELLYYVQLLSLTLVNEYHVSPGEIVCQCVGRSLSMVIGIMGIEMAGGVYCPLSSRDPQHRLHALTQQTQSRLVLVHHLTKTKFDGDIVSLDIDAILIINDLNSDMDYNCLSSVIVKGEEIAYIIFTSGSTGTPKAVQVRHKNFINSMHSLTYINSFNKDDTVVQMTRSSFDIHVQEILGTLLVGGTLIMLHPGGTIDFDYLSEVLQNKQITYLHTVPSLLHGFFNFAEQSNNQNVLKHLRSLCSSGEPFSVPLIDLIVKIGITNCILWNLYGPAEATIGSTMHCVDVTNSIQSIPIGRPFYNYRCMIMNKYFQSSAVSQEGELLVGGVGVFAGYLGRDDLTTKALIRIDGRLFYRTGDLVRIDNNGLLHYQGRKDHQIKLHGQRIELGEIERCLLNITFISACVVMKWKDDYLVAYVQSSDINEEQLRQHCQSHLPPHMIPSIFIILDKLPLNQNGKIDRKQLPSPDFSLSTLLSSDKSDTPLNQFEERIHTICVGGHSLLFIQLYHHYQSVFNFDAHTLSIAPFLQQPTIFQHSQLLQTVILNNIKPTQWYTLHINEGVASFAQERIFLDEQVRFSSDIAVYNELFTLQIVQGSLSFSRLLQAFRYVLNKHKILRTSLILNNDNSSLKQCITDIHKTFTITMNQTFENDTDLRDIIHRITINPTFFDFSIGCVFHAEILRHQISSDENENNSNEFIMNSDVLLIAFHHAAFDRSSRSIFFSDLYLAYNTNTISIEDDDESLQYIDYSVHERLIDMTISREFWYSQLEEYNFEYRLLLPVDRHRLFNDQRSSCASITQISFDNEISQSFLDYASLHHVTPFQLGLSILYAFLFKLTHGENDLCISCLNANRHKTELQSIMGMFVSILPYRIQLDPHRSFDDLVEYVRKKCLSILEHSHYPLQHILANLHINQSNSSFLETMFDFITISSHSEELSLDGTSFKQVSFKQSFEVAKFDFMVTFTYNPMLENNRLSFRLTCSHDLFDEITVTNIGRRLEYCFQQVFSSNEIINRIDTCYISISKVDLIVPEETQEMENAIFCRQSDIMNEAPASFAQARIWLDERIRFDPDKPQIAIYNMPFVYRLQPDHTLSIKQLRHALHLTINKHPSLHTSLLFDTGKHLIMQRIIDMNDNSTQLFTSIESTYETDEQLNQILHDERRNPQLFDLAQGLVFRCHIIYYKQISSNHLLSHKDVLIFNFHHALFDFPSMNIFLHDLNQAYTTGQLLYDDNTTLRYLDYAVIEQQMSMTGASMFWLDALHNCTLDQLLSLPFDRYRLSNEHRTGRGTSVSFDFGQDLSHDFLIYASSSNISLEQLALATYYVFLFKLTNGEKDLCIGINTHGRYRDELRSIIGMFVNAIPLRCLLDPHLSFHKLMEHVQDIMINCNKYSYFPLQRILNQHPNISNPVFLDTSFDFVSSMRRDEENEIMIGDNRFSLLPFSVKISEDEIMSKFDFILSFEHDLNLNEFSCTINASVDLFNAETVCIIARRLQTMLHQQFIPFDSKTNKPIHELSIILSNERLLIQSMNNTQISFPSVSCIHLEFVYQVLKHPQKLAVELDEQSLTYCELLYYVQLLSLTLVNEYHVSPGEIVCQCVGRSLSMVIGIMGIEMAGGVYCPLSSRDPQHRLHALTQQTQSRLVLVHHLTKTKFDGDIVSLDIDAILIINDLNSDMDYNCLSSVIVKGEEIAYIIFTSGSTGTPKAVQVRHKNFINSMHSLTYINSFNKDDTVVQMTRSSFDIHVQEILGTLLVGGTLIMLHPGGTIDFDYLSEVLQNKQITYLHTVPSLLHGFFNFAEQSNNQNVLKHLRSLCSSGEPFSVPLIDLIVKIGITNCILWNLYGPAEATIGSTMHCVDVTNSIQSIPIGRPFYNYRCMIMNKYFQSSAVSQEGELLVGGVGVFAGYLGRDDLTTKALIRIDGRLFYRTGDLVRIDNNGLLHYQGRKDHQIKLHGQRIELGEIERCLLNITFISACVVMKWKDDYLVAYVQSSDINEEQLRQHCQSHLPPHMIPSIFIILDKLPLNQNGKIDRKQLPSPDFSLSTLLSSDKSDTPLNQFEERIHTIWCEVLHCNENHISKTTSFF
ncbi:unnamed protein product, partial [Adineta steineri]